MPDPKATDLGDILDRMNAAGVEYIIVGGVAANLHGSAMVTFDLDVMYRHKPPNIAKLVEAIAPIAPYLRGAPPGLPFKFDEPTVHAGLNFTLTTASGPLDLLGEMAGVGRYEDALPHAHPMDLGGKKESLVIDLDWLIKAKRAAGRTKDLQVLAELELLRDLSARGESG